MTEERHLLDVQKTGSINSENICTYRQGGGQKTKEGNVELRETQPQTHTL